MADKRTTDRNLIDWVLAHGETPRHDYLAPTDTRAALDILDKRGVDYERTAAPKIVVVGGADGTPPGRALRVNVRVTGADEWSHESTDGPFEFTVSPDTLLLALAQKAADRAATDRTEGPRTV